MTVSLSWLLGRPELNLSLVAGPGNLAADTEIAWAHAIELEDPTPYLTGGELVLTTGLRLPRAALEQREYVERLAGADVAALAFGTGVRYSQIPRTVQETCDAVGLPLVEVPLPTPFIAITQAVAGRLAAEQLQVMQRALTHQKQATRSALRHGPTGVVRGLARELHAEVVLLDEYGAVVAASTSRPDLLDAVERERDRLARRRRAGNVSVATGTGTLEVQTLQGRTGNLGWLAVESAAALTQPERLLLNQTIALVTLLLDRPHELAESYRDLGATLLDLILEKDPAEEELVAHLQHFGFDPDDMVTVVTVTGGRDGGGLFVEVGARLEGTGRPRVITRTAAGVVVLVRRTDAGAVADLLASGLAESGRRDAVIGVSGGLSQQRAAAGLVPAEQAAVAARRSHERIGWFEELTLQAVLADDVVRSRIEAFAGPALAPLLDGTSRRDRELVASLEAFLRHNGAWDTAARALGVHRHTLRSHIERVEELTGLSLDVAENRVVLLLALMTARVEVDPSLRAR